MSDADRASYDVAEAEFAAAQAGITDKTPLVQAAQQFNSAAEIGRAHV